MSISVIIPAYNVEKYIEDCLNSVLNQTFKDLEIIVVDDGSDDGTLNIIEEYASKDNRINLIKKDNKGPGSARNSGLDVASGEYIYMLDSDDILDTNALEELYELSTEKNTDLIMFKSENFNHNLNEPAEDKYYLLEQMPPSYNNKLFSFNDLVDDFDKIDIVVYTKFFKQDLIRDVRFDEDIIFEDNIFTIDYIYKANRIYFYNKKLYNRRLRKNSIITSTSKKHTDSVEVNRRMINNIKKHGYYDKVKEKLFVKNLTKLTYRLFDIQDEYKEYFFKILKEDFTNRKEEILNELDFNLIDEKTIYIFNSLLESSNYCEFESKIN